MLKHDGGWREFRTACEGNYQYFSVNEGSSFLKVVVFSKTVFKNLVILSVKFRDDFELN